MADPETRTLVFADSDGAYYRVARVPESQRAELARLAAAGGGDTAGFLTPVTLPLPNPDDPRIQTSLRLVGLTSLTGAFLTSPTTFTSFATIR